MRYELPASVGEHAVYAPDVGRYGGEPSKYVVGPVGYDGGECGPVDVRRVE